jgi:hypothetical protein
LIELPQLTVHRCQNIQVIGRGRSDELGRATFKAAHASKSPADKDAPRYGASIVAFVGELEPTGVPQHVGMNEKAEFRDAALATIR